MIAARNIWGPGGLLMMSAGFEVIAIQFVKTAAGQVELFSGSFGFDMASPEVS
jgi:hypothetical protein